MKTLKSAKSLQELADVLNSMSDEQIESVDLSDLPTFGSSPVINTIEVFSWDDDNILVQDNGWKIEPRCPVCGEASFSHTY